MKCEVYFKGLCTTLNVESKVSPTDDLRDRTTLYYPTENLVCGWKEAWKDALYMQYMYCCETSKSDSGHALA